MISKSVRIFFALLGGWIFFSWGFRLYILTIRWETDPFRLRTLFFAIVFLGIGFFIARLAWLGKLLNRSMAMGLIIAAVFTIGYWGFRLSRLFLYPDIDPNPRSHLHLAVTYIVLGLALLWIAIRSENTRKEPVIN
ncbi:MAG: hypothetical protein AAB035_02210 [Nitrospirota bacterium]